MTLAATLWTAQDVANHLHLSRTQFYRRRPDLERDGFPVPIPHTRLYSPLAVIAWEYEASTGRKLDGVAVLEAAGLSNASTSRILAARTEALLGG